MVHGQAGAEDEANEGDFGQHDASDELLLSGGPLRISAGIKLMIGYKNDSIFMQVSGLAMSLLFQN